MRNVYMVLIEWTGSIFVKELEFFRKQGGFVQTWGIKWKPIIAENIEDARKMALKLIGRKI